MSEFVEIGGMLVRMSDIIWARPNEFGGTYVQFRGDANEKFDEPYESVRGKLMGAPVTNDRREELVRHLVAIFRNDKLHDVADRIEGYYHSAMLSEMEGAG